MVVAFKRPFGLCRIGSSVQRFASDESGAVLAFVLPLFLMMVVVSGGAVDFMRQEVERARLQDGLDRGVLAAAAFGQGLEAEDTVAAYLASARVPANVVLAVGRDDAENSRRVSAQAQYPLRTFFLKIIGIPNLSVVARAAAEQRRNKIEISLVLDITPSMNANRKMANMKIAAHEFIDTILTADTMEYTSVNLVPFGGQTNPGAALFGKLNVGRIHNYSSCITFNNNDFDTTTISLAARRAQFPHFQYSLPSFSSWGWCPDEVSAAIPMSNSAADLHDRIADMRMHGHTGIQNALKWGAAMLDPALQPAIASMAADGDVIAAFANRPAAWNDENTLKFAVLMTDGLSTIQMNVNPAYYRTAANIATLARTQLQSVRGAAVQVSTPAQSAAQLLRICEATKARGIILFTIGFEISSEPVAEGHLRRCASSAGHFYSVDGMQIADAFAAIARTIQVVRLVQ